MNLFLIKNLEGPENIHFILVNLIQNGNEKMYRLSTKFKEK
jgi:hypothetical protein